MTGTDSIRRASRRTVTGGGDTAMTETTALAGAGVVLASCAFALSAALCSRVRWWCPGDLNDYPPGSPTYPNAVPIGGGVALWLSSGGVLAAAAVVATWGRPWLPAAIARYLDGVWYRSGELGVIVGLSTAVMLAGLLADYLEPGWRVRLGLQTAAALALAAFGTRVTLFWPFNHPLAGGLVTTIWVVGVVNAFAFLDNMDGLATGVGLIAALVFAAAQAQAGSLFAPAVLLILAGGMGGVFLYNRYPARIFLGASGSWLIGFLLAALTVAGTYYRYGRHDSRNLVLSPLLVMAVPFYESAVVFLIWAGERDQPFLDNPRHFSYRLQEVGLSPGQSAGLLMLVSLGAGLGSLLLRRLDTFGTAVLLAQTGCLIGVVSVVEASAIRRKRSRRPAPSTAGPSRSNPTGPD